MSRNWVVILNVKGEAWGVPVPVTTGLAACAESAENVLAAATGESTRAPAGTARCREIFGQLADAMRDIKKRYFPAPLLRDTDFIAPGLRPADTTPAP
jgi:hypothetical protein